MLGFVLSNAGASGSLQAFTISVDEIEKQTGLDFFPQLENTLEQSLESKVNLSGWRFWEFKSVRVKRKGGKKNLGLALFEHFFNLLVLCSWKQLFGLQVA